MANLKAASCRIIKEGGNMVKQTKVDNSVEIADEHPDGPVSKYIAKFK